jgi:hypothetical protein
MNRTMSVLAIVPVALWATSAPTAEPAACKNHNAESRPPAVADYDLCAESSMIKVFADRKRLSARVVGEVPLSAAANEYESAQVVVAAKDADLHGVIVSVSDLENEPSGSRITRNNVELYRVGYVDSGWPDPLLPNAPFDVPQGKVQPVWVCFHVPGNTRAGDYRGEVTVRPTDGLVKKLRLLVHVFNFRLDDELPIRTTFLLPHGGLADEKLFTWIDIALRYKMSLMDMVPTNREPKRRPDGSYDFSRLNEVLKFAFDRHATCTALTDVGLGAADRPPEKKREFVTRYRATAANVKAHGWWDKCYLKTADEPKLDADGVRKLRIIADLMHEADPGYKVLITLNALPKDTACAGMADYWCPLLNLTPLPSDTKSPMSQILAQSRLRGGELWTYTCCWPPVPWTSVAFTEEDALAHRMLMWMCWRYGIRGYLYWGLKWWPPENFADKNWMNARKCLWPAKPWQSKLGGLPAGDGYLFYPDGQGGALPSIRAMLFRDGVEDYQYLDMLRRCTAGRAEGQSRQLLDLSQMCPDGWRYPRDPGPVLKRREAIAKAIETQACLLQHLSGVVSVDRR